MSSTSQTAAIRCVFITNPDLRIGHTDRLLKLASSAVVILFKFFCCATYLDRTARCLLHKGSVNMFLNGWRRGATVQFWVIWLIPIATLTPGKHLMPSIVLPLTVQKGFDGGREKSAAKAIRIRLARPDLCVPTVRVQSLALAWPVIGECHSHGTYWSRVLTTEVTVYCICNCTAGIRLYRKNMFANHSVKIVEHCTAVLQFCRSSAKYTLQTLMGNNSRELPLPDLSNCTQMQLH